MNPISIAVAGSTAYTTQLAESLRAQPEFNVLWIMTPAPKLIGRHQELTTNPLHRWAISNQLPIVTIDKKIDEDVKKNIESLEQPDILLVVDFGYMIPDWLLALPTVAPVNVHPSTLPRWRGSSPGQFVLLAGEQTSALSVLIVTTELDSGPLLYQQEFAVDPSWTQTEYYTYSFNLAAQQLPTILNNFVAQPKNVAGQSINSPTPIARRLSKADSFVAWEILKAAMTATSPGSPTITIPSEIKDAPVLETILHNANPAAHPIIIEHACRAFSPWPLVWTEVSTAKGVKRMQIIECAINEQGSLQLKTVKIEGLPEKPWHEVRNQLEQ